jgi:hypothetical protein
VENTIFSNCIFGRIRSALLPQKTKFEKDFLRYRRAADFSHSLAGSGMAVLDGRAAQAVVHLGHDAVPTASSIGASLACGPPTKTSLLHRMMMH